MIKAILGATLLTLLIGCATATPRHQAQWLSPDYDKYFADRKGCFLLYNMKTQVFDDVIGEDNCRERLPACSTFKIALSVMAFDSGVLKDENEILKWDGKKGFLPQHDRDHNAKTWLRDSVVWFSQRLTPQIGEAKLQKYLNDFNYGNKDLTAGITEAWLVRPNAEKPALKISGYEQVEFMNNLWTDKLPADSRAKRITRQISFLEYSPHGFKLSGKTGSNFYDDTHKIQLGWFISHLQKEDREYIAVANFSDLVPSNEPGYGGAQAKLIVKKILTDRGIW